MKRRTIHIKKFNSSSATRNHFLNKWDIIITIINSIIINIHVLLTLYIIT